LIWRIEIKPENLDFTRKIVYLKDVSLNNAIAAIRIGRKEQARIVVKEAEQKLKARHKPVGGSG
jgi:hypothetical protein